jgi:hypothetical protein
MLSLQVFWYFLTCTNVIVAAQLILGGSAVISTLTGALLLTPSSLRYAAEQPRASRLWQFKIVCSMKHCCDCKHMAAGIAAGTLMCDKQHMSCILPIIKLSPASHVCAECPLRLQPSGRSQQLLDMFSLLSAHVNKSERC